MTLLIVNALVNSHFLLELEGQDAAWIAAPISAFADMLPHVTVEIVALRKRSIASLE